MSSDPSDHSDSSAAAVDTFATELAAAVAWRDAQRRLGRRVVFTNGCFDLLHVGHTRYLAAARRLGDRLIVGVNDDESVLGLKGSGRPIVTLQERTEVLAALRDVDHVVPFGGATAVGLVRALEPDVYVKGGDYDARENRPPEADAAEANGASVAFVRLVEGRSTRNLIERIRNAASR